ncbi:MAG: endolytic transglycosylase MltG [Spirochaetia bacterium]
MTARRRKLSLVLGIPLGAIAVLAVAAAYLNSSPARPGAEKALLSIDRGENLSEISRDLQKQGFIRSAPLLEALARVRGTQGDFKAGWYRIPAGASTLAIHDLLVYGSQKLVKVTIPEGWTAGKIARHLQALGVSPAADFLAAVRSPELRAKFGVTSRSLEGRLFPDTYFVPVPFTGAAMAELMTRTFFDNLDGIAPQWREMDRRAVDDTIIMASIVEREYRAEDEAPLIASVFYNRLKRNIGLESCATLEYIITEIQQKAHPEYITLEDEKIDSRYNTYKWAGLPPGPISNPGRVALEAAFHPAQTGYLYFVLRDQQAGRHFFSRDLSEHNQAKYLYLKKS